MEVIIWHNNQCSTSRKVLDFLKQNKNEIQIRNYLIESPSIEELAAVLKAMHKKPEDIVRKKDSLYIEHYKDKKLSNEEWVKVLAENPKLIERPIVIKGQKAWLARPSEEFMENWKD